jgi:hypothetical protein
MILDVESEPNATHTASLEAESIPVAVSLRESNATSTHSNEDEFKVSDWVVVKYSMLKQKNTYRKFLGRILGINEERTMFHITFVRNKRTRQHNGYVYYYPYDPDEDDCHRDDILYKVEPPTEFQRGLKFSTNVNSL